MSDKPYMTHDLGARNDPKLVAAERASRGLYKAIWWDLAEMVWENGGYLPLDFDNLAYILRYPTPEEVRAVVMDFDLFVNDGERFWNNSALERIQHKQEVSAQAAANRRGKGAANNSRSTDEERPNNGRTTDENRPFDNKSINKSINKEINPPRAGAPAGDEERIFEILFFRNLADPARELERFRAHYWDGERWRDPSGSLVKSLDRAAQRWTPEKTGDRLPAEMLNFFKLAYAEAKTQGDGIEGMLEDLKGVGQTGQRSYIISYYTPSIRDRVETFIRENGLERGLTLKFTT